MSELQMKKSQKFPPGWDNERVKHLIDHYANISEDELTDADDAAADKQDSQVVVSVPNALLPAIRHLLATFKIVSQFPETTKAKQPKRFGKHKKFGKQWTTSEVKELRSLAKGNTPTRVIGLKLGRSAASIRSKAQSEGISLKPTNQSPYGTKKKQRPLV